MKGLDAQNTDDSAEDVGLLEVNINEFSGTIFDMLDGFAEMRNLQLGRQPN